MVALRTGLSLGAFSAPLSTRAPTRTPSRFNLFQASRARPRLLPSNSKTVARVFDVLSHSHLHSLFLPIVLFGSSSSVPEMGFSRPTLRVMDRSIYGTLPQLVFALVSVVLPL